LLFVFFELSKSALQTDIYIAANPCKWAWLWACKQPIGCWGGLCPYFQCSLHEGSISAKQGHGECCYFGSYQL